MEYPCLPRIHVLCRNPGAVWSDQLEKTQKGSMAHLLNNALGFKLATCRQTGGIRTRLSSDGARRPKWNTAAGFFGLVHGSRREYREQASLSRGSKHKLQVGHRHSLAMSSGDGVHGC